MLMEEEGNIIALEAQKKSHITRTLHVVCLVCVFRWVKVQAQRFLL